MVARSILCLEERSDIVSLDKVLPFDTVEEAITETSRTYYIDWENGRIAGMVTGKEAVMQYIKKAFLTERFACLIYDDQYGSDIRPALLRKGITREYIETEIPFLVKDTIIHDERILDVYNVKCVFGDTYPMKDSVTISMDVDTIFGKLSIKEVV